MNNLDDLYRQLDAADKAGDGNRVNQILDIIEGKNVEQAVSNVEADVKEAELPKDKQGTYDEAVRSKYPGLTEDQYKDMNRRFGKDSGIFRAADKTLEFLTGIETNEGEVAKDYALVNELRAKGTPEEVIKKRVFFRGPIDSTIEFASRAMTPASFLGSLANTMTLAGLKSGVDSAMEGDSKEEIAENAKESAGFAGALDAAIQGATRGLPLSVKGATSFFKKRGQEILDAKNSIKDLAQESSAISNKFKKEKLDTDAEEIALKKAKESYKDLQSKLKEDRISSISKPDKVSFDTKINNINKRIDEHVLGLINPLEKSFQKLRGSFKQKYNTILDGEIGATPVGIDEEISALGDALDIKSSSPKNAIRNIYSALTSLAGSDKAIDIELKEGAKSLTDDVNVTLKDAHWLKQALNDSYASLIKKPSTQELAISLKSISNKIDDRIDSLPEVSGKYKDVNRKYSDFMQENENANSFLGRLFRTGNEYKRDIGTDFVQNEIKKQLKAGRDISSDLVLSQSSPIRTIYAQARILADNGFDKEATAINQEMSYLAKKEAEKINLGKDFKSMMDDFKLKVDTLSPEEKKLANDIFVVDSKLKTLKSNIAKNGNTASKKIYENQMVADDIAKKARLNLSDVEKDIKILENSSIANTVLGVAGPAAPAIKFVLNAKSAINYLKNNGAVGAKFANDFSTRVDDLIAKKTGPFRTMLVRSAMPEKTGEEEDVSQ